MIAAVAHREQLEPTSPGLQAAEPRSVNRLSRRVPSKLRLLANLSCLVPGGIAYGNGIPVEISTSRVQALQIFVESVAGYPHRSEELKAVFRGSRFNTAESEQVLGSFRALHKALHGGTNGERFPHSDHEHLDVHQMLLVQGAYSRDLAELAVHSHGLLDVGEHVAYFRVLDYFDPIFEELVWRPNRPDLENARKAYLAAAQQWDLQRHLHAAAVFYRADWPQGYAMRVVLYPLPHGTRVSTAEHLDVTAAVGVIVAEKDLATRYGVIFHELCHVLYDAQPLAIRAQFKSWFEHSAAQERDEGFQYVNEVMATALGNGWMYKEATGHLNPSSWYDDRIIDRTAHQMLPVIERYVTARRAVDEEFVRSYLATFSAVRSQLN